jgi:hypothetical protein
MARVPEAMTGIWAEKTAGLRESSPRVPRILAIAFLDGDSLASP